MRIAPALLLLVALAPSLAAEPLRREPGQAVGPAARGGSHAVVIRDDDRREVQAWILPGETNATSVQPAAARTGRLIVRNRSGISADVYLADPADEPQWELVDTVPPGFKLIVRNLVRRAEYYIGAETTDAYDGFFDWGPRSFVMRRRFRYTLLP